MKVVLTVDSHVTFQFRSLQKRDPACFQAIKRAFTYRNPDYSKNMRLGYSTEGIPRYVRTFTKQARNMRVARGGLKKLRAILREHGHTSTIVDHRLSFPPIKFRSKITLRSEQREPVERMLKKQQGIVRGPCSSGKTVMLLEAIAKAKQPALVIVWDTNHQKQWIEEATRSALLNLKRSEIGGCGGVFKKNTFGKLNVCMQQSLWKEKNIAFFADRVGFVGCDEVQRFSARTFQVSINGFPAKFRIGVSANERRRDGKEFLLYDSFAKVIHRIPDTAIGSRKKARIYLVPTRYHSPSYDWNRNHTQLLEDMTTDQDRNKLILSMVKKSVAKGKLCLVLTERKQHALNLMFQLRKTCRTGLLIGNTTSKEIRQSDWPSAWKNFMRTFDNEQEFERVRQLGAKRKLDVVIGTQKGDVGISIKTFDHLFITTPTGSNIERFNQQKGRVERDHEGKATPVVFYFWDTKNDKLRENGNAVMKAFPSCSVLSNKKRKV